MDTNDYTTLIDIVRRISNSECRKIMNSANLSSNYFATILSVNDDTTYNVLLAGGDTPYTHIINKSGESLNIGDIVIIEAINGNVGNGYIKIKQGITSY